MWLSELVAPGTSALLGLTVLLILQGRLVPRSVLRDAVQAVERERDRWHQAALVAMEQNTQLLEGSRAMRDVVQALPVPEPEDGGSRR